MNNVIPNTSPRLGKIDEFVDEPIWDWMEMPAFLDEELRRMGLRVARTKSSWAERRSGQAIRPKNATAM